LAVQARRLEPQLTQQLGRVPRVADLAEWLEESTDRVLEALAAGASFRADSLDAPIGDGSLTKGATIAGADGDMGDVEQQMDVSALLDGLDERDREIVHLRFVEHRSQQEIADQLGVSQSYLSRLLRRTLATLREQIEDEAGRE
ncbi:MAG: sigma-70 family RNA polymerase sigma factor, partial [Acidimicrobiales bacterium]